jgi:hypothetical protein
MQRSAAFTRILWGLLISWVDLRVGGFNILPDIVGYGLIASGLAEIADVQERWRHAMILCFFLMPLSLVEYAPTWRIGPFVTGPGGGFLWVIAELVTAALSWVMIVFLLEGIEGWAHGLHAEKFARMIETRRDYVLVYAVAGFVLWVSLLLILPIWPPFGAFLLVVGWAIGLVLLGFILQAIHRTGERFSGATAAALDADAYDEG